VEREATAMSASPKKKLQIQNQTAKQEKKNKIK
jgi:hypothetical protein